MTEPVELGRAAFARQAWGDAYALLATATGTATATGRSTDALVAGPAEDAPAGDAGGAEPFEINATVADAGDLDLLAEAAHLLGRDDESANAWERAHRAHALRGDHDRAARAAFWLGFSLLLRGEAARAGGWLARAERTLEKADDGPARGYLLVPRFLEALGGGDATTAQALAAEIVAIAQRFDDVDLLALGMLTRGEAALFAGDTGAGMRLLDEAMVSVTTGEVSPVPAGIVYCAVIEACMDSLDLRRAAEWTEALHSWCSAQPDLVVYRGQCLVHRSQVLQAHGAWTEAVVEAELARRRLSDPAHPALGLALYQQAELHRLRGELDQADRAYRAAAEQGRPPAPGLALLRLAAGDVETATAAIQRMVDESRGHVTFPVVLAAAVEVHLAGGDVEAARTAADELAASAAAEDVPLLLEAIAAYAGGSVLLAEGDPSAGLAVLRRACAGWRDLEMPYDAARARVQIGRACRALGDHDAADMELDAARGVFERLGAGPDVELVARLAVDDVPHHQARGGHRGRGRPTEPARSAGSAPATGSAAPGTTLTERECEVLRLVARGMTNRQVASELVISEHTVARHLQNMFTKLGLSSRAAATAYAYEHELV